MKNFINWTIAAIFVFAMINLAFYGLGSLMCWNWNVGSWYLGVRIVLGIIDFVIGCVIFVKWIDEVI